MMRLRLRRFRFALGVPTLTQVVYRLLLIVAGLPLLLPFNSVRADPADQRVRTQMSFVPLREHGAPIVEIDFPGNVIGYFMVDTGADVSCMTDAFAQKLGLKVRALESRDLVPRDTGLAYVDVTNLQFGVNWTHAQFIVIPTKEFFNFGEEQVDGLIGGNMLRQSALLIDYAHQMLTVYFPGGLTDVERTATGMDGAPQAPIEDAGHNHFATDLTLTYAGKTATQRIFIDTGAPDTSITETVAEQLDLRATAKHAASTMQNGSVFANVAVVSQATVGNLTIPNQPITYPGRKSGSDIPPLLGENILGFCTVLFDFPAKKIYLKPTLPPLLASARTVPLDPAQTNKGRLRAAAGALPALEFSAALTGDPDLNRDASSHRLPLLLKQIQSAPDDAAKWDEIGTLRWHDKQEKTAMEAFDRSVALYQAQTKARPNDAQLLARYAGALTDDDRLHEAEAIAQKAIDLAPNAPEPRIALGWALHADSVQRLTGESKTVDVDEHDVSAFQALIARLAPHPPTPEAMAEAVRLSHAAGDAFDRAIEAAPQSSAAYAQRARFRNDAGLGISATLAALRNNDVDPNAYAITPKYVEDLQQAAQREPQNVVLQFAAAQAAVHAPFLRNEPGIDLRDAQFWQSLPIDARRRVQVCMDRLTLLGQTAAPPVAAQALEALAVLQVQAVHDGDAALATLKLAMEKDPTRMGAANSEAVILRDRKDYLGIIDLFTPQIETHDAPLKRLWLCYAYAKRKQWDDAQKQVDAAWTQRPDAFETNLFEARISLHNTRDADSAARLVQAKTCLDRMAGMLDNARDERRRNAYRSTLALYYGLAGQPEKARDLACAALDENRGDTEARDIVGAVLP